jgi:predicted nucleotidyltransferase
MYEVKAMKPTVATTPTNAMTLDELIARLSERDVVAGIVLFGSTSSAELHPSSDYDLLLVLDMSPAPANIITTWVNGRLAEVYCTTREAIDRLIADPSTWPDDSQEGAVVHWFRDGRIVHDRDRLLSRAKEALQRAPSPAPPDERTIYDAWRKLGYNLAHAKRFLAMDDPVAPFALDLRLLYSLADIMVAYFTVRRLPWRGEKSAVRYWASHDPDFLDRFQACVSETDRRRKVERYEALARSALAPVGGLWEVGTTVVAPGAGWAVPAGESDPVSIQGAQAFWRELIGDAVDPADAGEREQGHLAPSPERRYYPWHC